MKAAPGRPSDAMAFGEAEDNDWDGIADVLAQDPAALADSTRMPGAAYQSRLAVEDTRLPDLGYRSRLATADEGVSPERYAIGDVIGGRYEVLAIHRGTMGVVYGTFDRETKLPRALKTLQHRFAANTAMRDLFKEEATTWVRLEKHPFIVRAHLVERFDNQPYVITEYIRGQEGMAGDLRGWLGHPRLTLPVATEMALQIAQGMQHATRKVPGLVHRDLKPANILVDDCGRALVTDFGLAHAAEANAGTPAYMAPEQWRGEELDQRADIYAFGCVLHEMLTGRRLYPAVGLDEWRIAHLSRPSVRLREIKPGLPFLLDDLVHRCLAKEVAARPARWDRVVAVCAEAFHEETGQPAVLDFSAYELTASEVGAASYSLLELGKHQEALDTCARALQIDPGRAYFWNNKGNALQGLGRQGDAIPCYDRAIEIEPRSTDAWNNKGIAFQGLQRCEEAIACYDRVLDINPSFVFAWINRGNALYYLERHDEALVCYDRALDIDPHNTDYWFNKGLALDALQRYDEAIVCQDRVTASHPGNKVAWHRKGNALSSLRRYDEAVVCHDRGLEIDPRDAAAWLCKGAAHYGLKRYDEAFVCYDHAVEIDPTSAHAWYKKGDALQDLSRYSEAIDCYDRAIEIDPDDSRVWYDKACVLDSLERHGEAVASYDRAIELNPVNTDFWYSKGLALHSLRLYDEAIACYDRVLDVNPRQWSAWSIKAMALDGLERYEEAIVCYDRAIEGDSWAVEKRTAAVAALKAQRGGPSC